MNFTSVGIIGLGYVGLPLALRFAEVGVKVLGFDIDPDKVRQLNAGKKSLVLDLKQPEAVQIVRQIVATARTIIQTGKLDARVPARRYHDELSEMVQLFNQMLDKNQALIRAMRESLERTRSDAYTFELQRHGLESVEHEMHWLDGLIEAEGKNQDN